MKKLILIFLFCFWFEPVQVDAAAQLGITPCVIGQQPADLTFSGTSANRLLSTCGETLIVFNNSTNDARFRIGSGSSTAALTTDMLLAQKTFVVLNVSTAGLYFAAIGSGGGTISFIQGTASN
jgi:sorbitol-specific phosphotransferase system component IIA